jgi:hypothetical protein
MILYFQTCFLLREKIEIPKSRKNLDYVWITGIVYVPTTNKILVCNRNDTHMYLYDDFGRKLKDIPSVCLRPPLASRILKQPSQPMIN